MAAAVIIGASKIVWSLLRRLQSLRMYSRELRARRESIDPNGWIATVDGILADHGLANDTSSTVVADLPTATVSAQGLAKHDSSVTRVVPSAAGRAVWTADGARTVGLMSPRPTTREDRDDRDDAPIAMPTRAGGAPSNSEMMACPQCHTRHRGRAFCTADGREMVRARELSRFGGDEAIARFTGVPPTPALSGVMGALCPKCNTMHDLSEHFCGRDGTPLKIVN